MSGFYLMHRNWQDSPIFGREPFSRRDAWVWMIESAKWKSCSTDISGKTVEIKRGQFSHSLRFMAKAWSWDEAKVRRFLARAQREKMIDASTDAGQYIITICNYDIYQAPVSDPDAAADSRATQDRRGDDANKKEGKQGNNPEPDGSGAGPACDGEGDGEGQAHAEPTLPDPEKVMFDAGRRILAEAGIPPARAGPLLGKWKRDYGAEAVIVALGKAKREGAIHPTSFIEGVLRNGTGNRSANRGQYGSDFRDPVLFDLARKAHS